MKKLCIFISIAFTLFLLSNGAMAADKNTFVKATYGTVRTLDPACAYDVESGMRIRNIYDRLFEFDGDSTEKFLPMLATEVPTIANGGISKDGRVYTFEIRKGVKFQNGYPLTPEDVEYSLERSMIVDQEGGPSWMMLEAVTGYGSTREEGKIVDGIFKAITDSIQVKGNKVIITLPAAYPPLMAILQHSTNSIISKKWAIENGAWDGKFSTASKSNNPAAGSEPLYSIANGTGPYKLITWEKSKKFVFEKNDDYWGVKPTIQTAIVEYVPDWAKRKEMLKNGEADTVLVDNEYFPEIKEFQNIKTFNVPQLAISMAYFNQKINMAENPYVGSGKLDGEGITSDFFTDINIRKAFQHAFDYQKMKDDIGNGLIEIPSSPNVKGLPYHKDVPIPDFDLEKAKAYFMKAMDGQVWEKGFKMTLAFNAGNKLRDGAVHLLANNIMSINPKFKIEVIDLQWKDYSAKYRHSLLPVFILSIGSDIPDPHNFLYNAMHSYGLYGQFIGTIYDDIDRLCEEGIFNTDPEIRQKVYYQLQDIWAEKALAIGIYQQGIVKVYQNNIEGFIPNPVFDHIYEDLKRLQKL